MRELRRDRGGPNRMEGEGPALLPRRRRRDGEPNVPKLRFLPDTLPNSDPYSHFAQMRSERREEKFANGKKQARWVLVKESRPNHEFDKASMLMIFMAIAGIIGPPETGS